MIAEPAILSNDSLSVSRVPAPWSLAGSGYIFLFTFDPGFLRKGGFVPPELGDGFEATLGVLILVDYRESNVGPYRELLFLVGRNLRWRNHLFSVSRIYVSTEASAVNGRESWGLPKQTAQFQRVQGKDGAERVIVLKNGLAEVDLTVAPEPGLALPGTSLLLPPSWRTIVQPWQGRTYTTRLSGRGTVQRARLLDFRTLPHLFPDVGEGTLVRGIQVRDFRMRFPAARITP
ncbi:MAG TPA: acetoacetate decarboxylase family protein [Thermoanaerobaculia bacterium]|nr:acetoacetate decarboxylase family protein [Thermoanaerobaculia bacterium]